MMIASGRGIKTGLKLGVVSNLDIAPRIAAPPGWKMPAPDGLILNEFLEP